MTAPQVKRLGEIATVIMGQSPPGDTYNSDGNGLPFFQGKAEFGEESPTPVKWCTKPSRIAEAGDILMSVRAPVGPTNYADQQCCIGRGLAAIRAHKEMVNQRYLGWFLKRFEADLARKGVGSTFSAINRKDIEALEVPVPPLTEQERIVRLLDEADDIRKLRVKADQRTADLIPALFHQMFGDPITNLMGWPVKRLDEVAVTSSGGTPSRKHPEYFGPGYPWVKSGELAEYVVMTTEESITEAGLENSSAKLLTPGTILVAMYGATVGAVSELGITATTNQAVCAINPTSEVHATYLRHAIQMQTRKLLQQRVGGAQPNISQGIIRNLSIPIPPLESQIRFDQCVQSIRQNQEAQSRSGMTTAVLGQSLVTDLFRYTG